MKLILSSCDFNNQYSKKIILDYLSKDLFDYKILFIPNEKATTEKINSNKYYNRLREIGFTKKDNIYIFDELNVENFRNLDIDLLYISGGNTFATLDKIRKCNFDKDIINYIKNGVIYIGGSCGAHIVTKNIEHVANFDENYIGMTDFCGLDLCDCILLCHYDESRKKIYNKLLSNSDYKIYKLTNDDSVVVIDDDIIEYKGSEIYDK